MALSQTSTNTLCFRNISLSPLIHSLMDVFHTACDVHVSRPWSDHSLFQEKHLIKNRCCSRKSPKSPLYSSPPPEIIDDLSVYFRGKEMSCSVL
ncbi:hypothetical protein TNIN_364401 [Trichonephila inaurata madagascariensis]|uniref:Uncharacterized protein n=1 Tax=Trichonephila inaurata madagascariensis TaxID=2747483 RepID=A0A8X6X6T1_9ARAC|nr:hypothetical protein TNIN_364401 [Trichonephila inaurata madagascariensis]